LHSRYCLLTARQKKPVIVVAALARELCGFVWAIAGQVSAPEKVKMRAKGSVKEAKAIVPTTPAPAKTSPVTDSAKKQYQLDSKKMFKKHAANAGATDE
jgi:hypothetical protein